MAKQRGIHQIKGKINNLCYYEQKYVKGGLIRRINEAMSERLKSDPAFANTRHANAIFGGASMCAGALLEFFSSRATYLFKPYRQALLTKLVMKDLSTQSATSAFPAFLPNSQMVRNFPSVIDNIVKNKLRDYFPTIGYFLPSLRLQDEHEFEIPIVDLLSFCDKNKCIGVQFTVSPAFYTYSTSPSAGSDEYLYPDVNPGGRGRTTEWLKDTDSTNDLILSASTGEIDDGFTFWIIYANPILRKQGTRTVTGKAGASCCVVGFSAH